MRNILESIRKFTGIVVHPRLRNGFFQALPFWVGAVLVGLISVGYAKVFSLAEKAGLGLYGYNPLSLFIFSPAAFIFSWALVHYFAPLARGSGIPQVSAAIELTGKGKASDILQKLLGLRIIVVKIVSSLILVFGGGSIGREGPTIQLAASVFKKIHDWLPVNYPKVSKKNMLITGAASGLAAAFNTPLGGIVFAIEELTKTHFNNFKSALLSGVILAGLTALSISGPYLYLGYPSLGEFPFSVLWVVIPVALLIGLLSSGLANLILRILFLEKPLF